MQLYKVILIFTINKKIKSDFIHLLNIILINKGIIQHIEYFGIKNTLFNNKSIKKNSKGLYITVHFFGSLRILKSLKLFLNYCNLIKRYMILKY